MNGPVENSTQIMSDDLLIHFYEDAAARDQSKCFLDATVGHGFSERKSLKMSRIGGICFMMIYFDDHSTWH